MERRIPSRTPLAAAVALAAFAGVLQQAGGATPGTSPVTGIVDINTNLGYQRDEAAAGTGIVLTSSGEILTNNHVIRGATTVKVTDVDNGRTYAAAVVGYDVADDVAVVQLKSASNLQTAPLGTSAGLKIGQAITAYGNAGGRGGTPSSATGKILGFNRSITAVDDSGNAEKLTGLIETDATLEPGDSGGPIVDGNGEVIGMDTAASSSFRFEFQTPQSRGFSIPIAKAKAIAAKIVARQRSARIHVGPTAFMGLSVVQRDSYFGDQSGGLTIADVVPGSPIDKAGLAAGDVVTAFDGKAVNTPARLSLLVVTKAPGDTVRIRWVDEFGTAHTATLRLASGPPQ